VSVRFYFTDTEAKNLIAATGCGLCSKPADPYELGITKYSGNVSDENGTLSDNNTGIYQYITPANTMIVPYDNGYYAEFQVSSFSEFWLNNGGPGANNPLPLTLVLFEATKQGSKGLLQWKTENETNISKFIVERSSDGRDYVPIGSISANNILGSNSYSLTDQQPKGGLNYYRLRIIDRDGKYTFSPIRKLNFGSAIDEILVYPNPVARDSKIYISSSGSIDQAVLIDGTGKQVMQYSIKARSAELNVKGIARGIYQLKIQGISSMQTKKIVIQ
jgi:hypothetical protein